MRRTARITNLLKELGHDRLLLFERAFDNNPTFSGYLIAAGELLAVRAVHDFALDGVILSRLSDVDAVVCEGPEAFMDHVLRQEGGMEDAGPVPLIPVSDWRAALETVRRLGEWVILECEDDDATFVGELLEVGEGEVTLRPVGSDGIIDELPEKIPLDLITLVRFGERYIKMYQAYAELER